MILSEEKQGHGPLVPEELRICDVRVLLMSAGYVRAEMYRTDGTLLGVAAWTDAQLGELIEALSDFLKSSRKVQASFN